jgi:hypothetical protein
MREENMKILNNGWIFSLISVSLLASACSEQGFVPGTLNAKQASPGTFTLPAKVDIILAEDDSPSMAQALPTIKSQIPQFLSQLESSGWDYRLVTTPLTVDRPFNQILASKYDANWFFNGSGQWLPPFPGADPSSPGMMVLSNLFATPASYGGFLTSGNINWTVGQYENGFQSIQTAITNHAANAQLIRDDAMLAVIVIGNGNDGSGLNFCSVTGWAGPVPCEYDSYCAPPFSNPSTNTWHPSCENPPSGTASMNQYDNFFAGLDNPSAGPAITANFRFYSLVSYSNSSSLNCIQSNSTVGSRYIDMANRHSGKSFDICTKPISTALGELSTELQGVKKDFVTRYLVISQEPELSTIEVVRYINGDPSQPEIIPQDPINGWTYLGGPMTVKTIEEPVPMNEQTGFVIELNGTAKIVGDDGAAVNFQVKGGSQGSG